MGIKQFEPFKLAANGEPFLPLRAHKNIILTPMRWTDATYQILFMNDPKIAVWLSGPPFPYRQEDADAWLARKIPPAEAAIKELMAASDDEPPKIMDDCILSVLRQVNEDGTETVVGDIRFFKCPWGEIYGPDSVNWDLKEKREQENNERLPGDPETVWTVGYWINPKFQGKGIASDAVNTLLHEWAIPRMGVKKMIGATFVGNEGSLRVMEKVGMRLREVIKNYHEVKGEMRDLYILDWKLEDLP